MFTIQIFWFIITHCLLISYTADFLEFSPYIYGVEIKMITSITFVSVSVIPLAATILQFLIHYWISAFSERYKF